VCDVKQVLPAFCLVISPIISLVKDDTRSTTGLKNLAGLDPNLKLPQLNNLMGTRATIPYNICHYADEDGRRSRMLILFFV
jgi:hypothetical protein